MYRLIKLKLLSVFIQLFISDSLAWMNWMKFRVPLALRHISERGDAEKDVESVCGCVRPFVMFTAPAVLESSSCC